jgi:hypothetical protein
VDETSAYFRGSGLLRSARNDGERTTENFTPSLRGALAPKQSSLSAQDARLEKNLESPFLRPTITERILSLPCDTREHGLDVPGKYPEYAGKNVHANRYRAERASRFLSL